jgi:pSer/pThr/pTyr-binding forkhead associated (FHA) protein
MSKPMFPVTATLLDAREVPLTKFDALYAKITQERNIADGYFLQTHPKDTRLLFVINGAPYGAGCAAGGELGFLEIHEFFAAYQQHPTSPLSFFAADKRLLLGLMVLFRHTPSQTVEGAGEAAEVLQTLAAGGTDAILGLRAQDAWAVTICTKGKPVACFLPPSGAEAAKEATPGDQLVAYVSSLESAGVELRVYEETRVSPAEDATHATPENRGHLSEVFLRLAAQAAAEAAAPEEVPALELESVPTPAPAPAAPPPPPPVEERRAAATEPPVPATMTIKAQRMAPPAAPEPEGPVSRPAFKGPIPDVLLCLGDKELGRFSLAGGELTIGRTTGNSIVIENAGVSRRHAVIRVKGEQVFVEDLGSANGTFVRGEKVTSQELKDGDEITIVKHKLVYRIPKEGDATPKAAPAADAGQRTMYIDPAAMAQAMAGKGPQAPQSSGRTEVAAAALRPRLILPDLKKFPLEEEEVLLGSGANCQIKLSGMFVGKEHAKVVRTKEGQHMLVHLGGLAGTRVNGEKVTEHVLKHGDEIEIGKQKLLFRLER